MTYTVEERNTLIGTRSCRGQFISLEAATTYAQNQARRSRKFVSYQVCQGTQRNAHTSVGAPFVGEL